MKTAFRGRKLRRIGIIYGVLGISATGDFPCLSFCFNAISRLLSHVADVAIFTAVTILLHCVGGVPEGRNGIDGRDILSIMA